LLFHPAQLKTVAQRSSPVVQTARRSLSIPVNQVARVMRMTVAGEPEAEKVDKIVNEMLPDLKGFDGFNSVTRHVCKTEWAYEVAVVFDGLENFKSYMESDKREELIASHMGEIEKFAVDGNVYSGNRVHDNF
jgi:antibiotic biosynthesis monooxygenase (ABM) superfamily enzyme